MPKISMTGTRRINSLTEEQLANFRRLMLEYKGKGYTHLNHGDAIGADALAHDWALKLGLEVVIYPPDNTKYRAFCEGGTVMPEDTYKRRNQSIVDNGNVLLALPDTNHEYNRSGTWMAVRQARKSGLPTIICYPNGRMVKENFGGLFEDE